MTKVLLSNMNSVWGVIAKPQSSNVYRHILSFDTPQLKEDFITQKLFNGTDYNTLLDQAPKVSYTQQTSMIATWKIDPRLYPNETFVSLMNKDFAIITEDGIKRFYAITDAQRQGQMIVFTGELDIFFTYDIKDMFNDNYVRIANAQSDRFFVNDTNEIKPIVYKPNSYKDEPIYFPEKFQNITDENLVAYSENLPLIIDYSKYVVSSQKDDQVKIDEINKIMSMKTWTILYFDTKEVKFAPYGNNVSEIPYCVTIGESAINRAQFFVEDDIDNPQESREVTIGHSIADLGNANVLHTSYTTIGINPFANLRGQDFRIKLNDGGDNIVFYIPTNEITNGSAFQKDQRTFYYVPKASNSNALIINLTLSANSILQDNKTPDLAKIQQPIFPDFNGFSITNKVVNNHEKEVKSYFYPYRTLKVKTASNSSFDVKAQFCEEEELKFFTGYGYMTENWYTYAIPQLYKNIYNRSNTLDTTEDEYFRDIQNYSLPTDIVAWNEFMARNKAQQSAGWLSNSVGAIGGLALGVGSAFTGSGLGVIGGISSAYNSAKGLINQYAQRQDIKNTPNQVVSNGSTLTIDADLRNLYLSATEYRMLPNDELVTREHFYKYGHDHNNKMFKLNDKLKTRYIFNYIEVPESFENMILQASADIKQIINDTLSTGVTIWHVRDLSTFKGIKNYEYENLEMSIYNHINQSNDEPNPPHDEWNGVTRKIKVW